MYASSSDDTTLSAPISSLNSDVSPLSFFSPLEKVELRLRGEVGSRMKTTINDEIEERGRRNWDETVVSKP